MLCACAVDIPIVVLYPILLSQSWSTTVPNFMLVSGIAQSGQNLALSRLAISLWFSREFTSILKETSTFVVFQRVWTGLLKDTYTFVVFQRVWISLLIDTYTFVIF